MNNGKSVFQFQNKLEYDNDDDGGGGGSHHLESYWAQVHHNHFALTIIALATISHERGKWCACLLSPHAATLTLIGPATTNRIVSV